MKKYFNIKKHLSIFLFVIAFPGCSQDHPKVMFYNVENLFDTVDDTLKNDDEFTPNGLKKWDNFKLDTKITQIAKVIIGNNFPDLVGLAEVENDSVLTLLCKHSLIRKQQYDFIHFESPDKRGIDCAFLFKSAKWNLIFAKPIQVSSKSNPTRDILACTLTHKKDTFCFFINHWPSRYGGVTKSEPKRIQAAQMLLQHMDSVTNRHPHQTIITMGDFNDEPQNSSLQLLSKYYNYGTQTDGTIKYKGKWQTFDMFISNKRRFKFKIFKPALLLEKDVKYGGFKPNRTYYGPFYNGGYSDHLPIILELSL